MLSSAWRGLATRSIKRLVVFRADCSLPVLGVRFCHKMAEEAAKKMAQMGVSDGSSKSGGKKGQEVPPQPLEVSGLLAGLGMGNIKAEINTICSCTVGIYCELLCSC